MIKKFLRKIFCEDAEETSIKWSMERLNTEIVFLSSKIAEYERDHADKMALIEDVEERTHKNLAKLNSMLNEYKGMVSMARASIPKRGTSDGSDTGQKGNNFSQ